MTPSAQTRSDFRKEMQQYFAAMVGVLAAMPEDAKAELEAWEVKNLSRNVGTSDWPGWEKYIGQKPTREQIVKPYQKQSIPADLRWQVWERDNFTCQKCGMRQNLSVDHIHPESKGGPTGLENLQTLCKGCNSKKGAKLVPKNEET